MGNRGKLFGDREIILEVRENLLSNALCYAKNKSGNCVVSVTYSELKGKREG